MSNEVHVLSIELHQESLIVITVESDANSKVHSIVLDLEAEPAIFNIGGLLGIIQNTHCESIRDKLKTIEWSLEGGSPLTPITLYQRLSRILMSLLTSQAMQVSKQKPPYNLSGDQSNSISRASMSTPEGGQRIPARAKPRTVVRASPGGEGGSSRKKPRTETPPRGTPRGSSGSALTNLSTGSRGPKPVIDYEKAAKTQETFLCTCQDCYPFGVETSFLVNIDQMIVAQDARHNQDAVVVRTCEMKIV